MQQGFRAQRDKTPFGKLAQAFARTRLGGWLFVHVFPVIDRRLIPLTGGRRDGRVARAGAEQAGGRLP